MKNNARKNKKLAWMLLGVVLLLLFFFLYRRYSLISSLYAPENQVVQTIPYGLHQNIATTVFWSGEKADFANSFIQNSASAWDVQWKEHYGGVDDPKNRNGFFPADFAPKENPFYFALPYNDFDQSGKRKSEVYELIPWAGDKTWNENESMCKNQWVKIIKNEKIAYAQWEDVGPYGENDGAYVFGDSQPLNGKNQEAGIDVSPAVRDYLGLVEGIDMTDWQFVNFKDIPSGPWKKIVTTSQIFW